jgi:hypothetical protein
MTSSQRCNEQTFAARYTLVTRISHDHAKNQYYDERMRERAIEKQREGLTF